MTCSALVPIFHRSALSVLPLRVKSLPQAQARGRDSDGLSLTFPASGEKETLQVQMQKNFQFWQLLALATNPILRKCLEMFSFVYSRAQVVTARQCRKCDNTLE